MDFVFFFRILGEVVEVIDIIFYLDNVFFVVNSFLFIKEMNVYRGDMFFIYCFLF